MSEPQEIIIEQIDHSWRHKDSFDLELSNEDEDKLNEYDRKMKSNKTSWVRNIYIVGLGIGTLVCIYQTIYCYADDSLDPIQGYTWSMAGLILAVMLMAEILVNQTGKQ